MALDATLTQRGLAPPSSALASAGCASSTSARCGRARSIEHLTVLAIAINRRHHLHDARFRVIGL